MLKVTFGMQEVAFNILSYLGNMPMLALVHLNYRMCGTWAPLGSFSARQDIHEYRKKIIF